jgi:hypothetical protein
MLSYCNHLWIGSFWDCFTDTVSMNYNSSNKLIHLHDGYCGGGGGHDNSYFYNTDGSPDSIYYYGWGSMGDNYISFTTFEYFNPINSVEEIDQMIVLFPNPARSKISISSAIKITSATCFNSLGEEVLFTEFPHEKNITLQLPILPSGIYFLRILDENQKVFTRKIVISSW